MNILKHFDKLIAVSFAFVMGVAVSAGNTPVYNYEINPYQPSNMQPPFDYNQYPQPMPGEPPSEHQPPICPNHKQGMPKPQMGQKTLQQTEHNKIKKQPAIKKTKIDEQRNSD